MNERRVFVLVSLLVFAYLVLRAVLVPAIHDEAMTFFTYVETGEFIPFHAHWDAGNHVLCTALAWCCYKTFGFHLWALRVPSVLAFLLWAAYAFRWGRVLEDRLVRWCFWSALLLMPFLSELFSLFRGYGLAMAFWSAALFHVCLFARAGGRKDLLAALLFLLGASFSAMSLLTLHGMLLFVLCATLPRGVRGSSARLSAALTIVLLGIAPLVYLGRYVQELDARGLLYFGTHDGLVLGTISSVQRALFGTTYPWLSWSVFVVILVVFILAWRYWSGGKGRVADRTQAGHVLLIGSVLLFADALLRKALHHWHGTLYPQDRTALQWLLLFLLPCAVALDKWARQRPVVRYAALTFLVLPIRSITWANADTTSYWPEQAIPASVQQFVEGEQGAIGRPITISGYHQMPGCWAFEARARGLAVAPLDVSGYPANDAELIITDPMAGRKLPDGYEEVQGVGTERLRIFKRKQPFRESVLLDTVFTINDDQEFHELWHPDARHVQSKSYRIEITATVTSGSSLFRGALVNETDRTGDQLHYDSVPLQFIRPVWQGDTLRLVRTVPQVPDGADRVVCFLWNTERQPWTMTGRLRVLSLER